MRNCWACFWKSLGLRTIAPCSLRRSQQMATEQRSAHYFATALWPRRKIFKYSIDLRNIITTAWVDSVSRTEQIDRLVSGGQGLQQTRSRHVGAPFTRFAQRHATQLACAPHLSYQWLCICLKRKGSSLPQSPQASSAPGSSSCSSRRPMPCCVRSISVTTSWP